MGRGRWGRRRDRVLGAVENAGWSVRTGAGAWILVMHAVEMADETRDCINFSGCLFFFLFC